MPELQRGSTSTSVIDVLDHILDKGIVIDAWVRVSIVGIDLLTVEARVIVASIDTYLSRADAIQMVPALTPLDRGTVWHHPPLRPRGEGGSVAANLGTRKR
jgi:Gas vesicle protein